MNQSAPGPARRWIRAIAEYLRRGSLWTELASDPGHRPEEAISLFHLLRREGIRVRYRVVGIGGGPGTPIGSVGQTLSLIVHRDDVPKAQQLIDAARRG